jgi:hypothetical protein
LITEKELERKKKKLLRAKAKYRELAREFIDQWVEVRRPKGFMKQRKIR